MFLRFIFQFDRVFNVTFVMTLLNVGLKNIHKWFMCLLCAQWKLGVWMCVMSQENKDGGWRFKYTRGTSVFAWRDRMHTTREYFVKVTYMHVFTQRICIFHCMFFYFPCIFHFYHLHLHFSRACLYCPKGNKIVDGSL